MKIAGIFDSSYNEQTLPRITRTSLIFNQDFRFYCAKTVCDRRFAGKYGGRRPPASESPINNHSRELAKLVPSLSKYSRLKHYKN